MKCIYIYIYMYIHTYKYTWRATQIHIGVPQPNPVHALRRVVREVVRSGQPSFVLLGRSGSDMFDRNYSMLYGSVCVIECML